MSLYSIWLAYPGIFSVKCMFWLVVQATFLPIFLLLGELLVFGRKNPRNAQKAEFQKSVPNISTQGAIFSYETKFAQIGRKMAEL